MDAENGKLMQEYAALKRWLTSRGEDFSPPLAVRSARIKFAMTVV